MEKIKIITDTACDLPAEFQQTHHIEMIPIAIMVDDKDYTEKQNEDPLKFYEVLKKAKTVPKTSQITMYQFLERFERAYEEGYTHILGLFLPSSASGTYQNALLAKREFYEEHPEAKGVVIEIPDSRNYSLGYGYPIARAAEMTKEAVPFKEILNFVEEWLDQLEIYFSMYTLEFARKSGRIGKGAAIVGDALGLKPIIHIKDGEVSTYKKVRGKKAVIKELARIAEERMKTDSEYMILKGENEESGIEMAEVMREQVGYEPFGIYYSGPAVTINSGPEIIGIGFRGKS